MRTGRARSAAYVMTAALVYLLSVPGRTGAQTIFLDGQNIQPVFEGWERNPDGTFALIFGYLNRNYRAEPYVPVGPDNSFSPGPVDQGQPTHFYPRRQSFLFKVTVPADWGDKKLIWTLTLAGKTATAVGKLLPLWEVSEGVWNATRLGSVAGVTKGGNAPPTIKFIGSATSTVTLPEVVTLTVSASDDGKPGAARPVGGRQSQSGVVAPKVENAPLTTTGLPTRTIGRDNPYFPRDRVAFADAKPTGLAVTWLHYRGPGAVAFEPAVVPIKSAGPTLAGTAKTAVHFTEPGTYVIRAVADDGILTTPADVTVVVNAAVPAAR